MVKSRQVCPNTHSRFAFCYSCRIATTHTQEAAGQCKKSMAHFSVYFSFQFDSLSGSVYVCGVGDGSLLNTGELLATLDNVVPVGVVVDGANPVALEEVEAGAGQAPERYGVAAEHA